jgi:hypothetical protein
MHSKLASGLGTCEREQKNKEMNDSSGLCSRDADTTASPWRKEHGSKVAWRAAKWSGSMQNARQCAKVSEH